MEIHGVQGVIFDMDGTLIDSEIHTETAVTHVLMEHGLDADGIDWAQFYGITWERIATMLRESFDALQGEDIASAIEARFAHLLIHEDTPLIDGVGPFLGGCCRAFPTAIATSNNRRSLDHVVERLDVEGLLHVAVSAEDYERSKPDPECYLMVADDMDLAPENCLVFEDSIAGIEAARNAGMFVVAVTHRSPDVGQATALADRAIENYTRLEPNFLERIQERW